MALSFGDRTVILANGDFPRHAIPLRALREAARVICCDGAAETFLKWGGTPAWIVGDGDSLADATRDQFKDRIVCDADQATNDLSKAFRFALANGWRQLLVLGATGKREDHTLGNLSLLADFAEQADIRLLTDTGIITPLIKSDSVVAVIGQPLSLIACDAGMKLSATGLKYPVRELCLTRWWQATLNEATEECVRIEFSGGALLVYQAFRDETADRSI